MQFSIKLLFKRILPPRLRYQLKRFKRKLLQIKHNSCVSTIEELENILRNNLHIQAGDKLFITSSFGNLNAKFSPKELIELLQDIITEKGVIMMPYYPPMNSEEWARKGLVFNMNKTKSGMGILTNVFSQMPNVYMSTHPTKAVCIWGKDAEALIVGHDNSTTPFYWDSPYGKFLKLKCKTLGFGVTNNPMFHTIEDVVLSTPTNYYLSQVYELSVITKENTTITVNTLVHDPNIIDKCVSSEEYIRNLSCTSYNKQRLGPSYVYMIDNNEVYEKVQLMMKAGNIKLRQYK